MSLRKNQGSQYILFKAYLTTADTGVTGDAGNITMQISLNGGAEAASTNSPTEIDATTAPGWYQLQLSQAETNAESIHVVGASTTANVEIEGKEYHTFQWTYDGVAFEDFVLAAMAVLFGETTRTATSTVFTLRDGTTTKVTVTHDSIGNRTVSTLA